MSNKIKIIALKKLLKESENNLEMRGQSGYGVGLVRL